MSFAARGFSFCPECQEPRLRNPFAARCSRCTEKRRESQGLAGLALPEPVDWVPSFGSVRAIDGLIERLKSGRKRFVVNQDS